MKKKVKPKKIVKVVPKYLPLAKTEGEILVDTVFFYAAVAVIAVSVTCLALSFLNL